MSDTGTLDKIMENIQAGIKDGVTAAKVNEIADSIMDTLSHNSIIDDSLADAAHEELRAEIATDIKEGLGI